MELISTRNQDEVSILFDRYVFSGLFYYYYYFFFFVLVATLVDLVRNLLGWGMDVMVALFKTAEKAKAHVFGHLKRFVLESIKANIF